MKSLDTNESHKSIEGSGNSVVEIHTRLLQPGDEDTLLQFIEKHLKNWKKFRAFWEWRRNKPFDIGDETFSVAFLGDKLVGCIGIVPVPLKINEDIIDACWQQDSLVDPSVRGKGVGKRLVETGARNRNLLLAKGTSRPMYFLRKSVGFNDVKHSNYLVRVNKVRWKGGDTKKLLAEWALRVWQHCIPRPAKEPDIQLTQIDEFDESFDTLKDDICLDNSLRIEKDTRYLNWRYANCPVKQYTIIRSAAGPTRGAIVLSISGDRDDEGWIVDLICSAMDGTCGRALIRQAIEHFEARGVSRIWVFATHASKRKWFARFGFVPTKFTPRFTYRVEIPGIEPKIRGFDWDFWHGDGDVELYM